jgi:isoamylase
VIRLRNAHPAFRRRGWFKGRPLRGKGISDIAWLRIDGEPMSEDDWQQGFVKSLMVFLNGDALHELDEDGKRVRDDSFLLLFNAHYEPLDFTLPPASFGEAWTIVVDTATEVGERNATLSAGSNARVEGRSLIVLSRP